MIKTLINRISLPDELVKEENNKKFKSLLSTIEYQNMLNKLQNYLLVEREKYSNDSDFYQNVALQFVQEYIPQIIKDYGMFLGDETIQKLTNIKNGYGLKIFNPGEAVAQGYVDVDEKGNPSGDVGAFARPDLGIIGFTPANESNEIDFNNLNIEGLYKRFPGLKGNYDLTKLSIDEIKKLITIENAKAMICSMIHETFHLLICVKRDERFYYNKNGEIKSKLTSGGVIIDEGLVDKFAIDFARKHDFYHLPGRSYFDYVKLGDEIEKRLGSQVFRELAFNSSYYELLGNALTEDEYEFYQISERKKYFQDKGLTDVEVILNKNDNLGLNGVTR